jgi:hypothetical protein
MCERSAGVRRGARVGMVFGGGMRALLCVVVFVVHLGGAKLLLCQFSEECGWLVHELQVF